MLSACLHGELRCTSEARCDTLLKQVLHQCPKVCTLVAFVEHVLDGTEEGMCPCWWDNASDAELLHDAAWVLNHVVDWDSTETAIRDCVQHVLRSTGEWALKPYFVTCEIAGDLRGSVALSGANASVEPDSDLLKHVQNTLDRESAFASMRATQGKQVASVELIGELLRRNTLQSACTLHAISCMTHKLMQTIKRSTLFSLFSNNQHGARNPGYEHLATVLSTHLLRSDEHVRAFRDWLGTFEYTGTEAAWHASYQTVPLTCIRSAESRQVATVYTRMYAFGNATRDCLLVPAGSQVPELCTLEDNIDESIRSLLFRFFDTVSAKTTVTAFPFSVFALDAFLAAHPPPFPYSCPLFGQWNMNALGHEFECVECEVDHASIEFECSREMLPRLVQCSGYIDAGWQKVLCRSSGLLKLAESDTSDLSAWESFTQPCDIHTCVVEGRHCVHMVYGDTSQTFDLTPDVAPTAMRVSTIFLDKPCGNDDAYCLLVSNHSESFALTSDELHDMSLAHLHNALRKRFTTITLCQWQRVAGCDWYRKPTLFSLKVAPYPSRNGHVHYEQLTRPRCAQSVELLFDQKTRADVIKAALCHKKTHMRDSELCDAWAHHSSPLAQVISAQLLGVTFEDAPHALQNLRMKLQDRLSPRLCETGRLMQSELMIPHIKFSQGQFPSPLLVVCMLQTMRNTDASMRTDSMFEQLLLARRPVIEADLLF